MKDNHENDQKQAVLKDLLLRFEQKKAAQQAQQTSKLSKFAAQQAAFRQKQIDLSNSKSLEELTAELTTLQKKTAQQAKYLNIVYCNVDTWQGNPQHQADTDQSNVLATKKLSKLALQEEIDILKDTLIGMQAVEKSLIQRGELPRQCQGDLSK